MVEQEKLSPVQFGLFRDFIYQNSGIRVEISKITLVTNRVRRRLKATGLDSFDDYYKLLIAGSDGEVSKFLDAVTTNETSFFRTPKHFEWFQHEFLAEFAAKTGQPRRRPPARVWSAACSTGEEPYSLAMCVLEAPSCSTGRPATILATDISARALDVARQGVYQQRAVEGLEPRRRSRWFRASADGKTYTVRPTVQELVEFKSHNLMNPLAEPPFDCIFIRNVLIYFDRASKLQVVRLLIDSLAPAGYLVVGPSEGIYDMLSPLVKRSTFLYQKAP